MTNTSQISALTAGRVEALRQGVVAREDFVALRGEVQALIRSAGDSEFVYSTLEQMRADFQATADEQSEDLVMDLMDLIVGWCGPHSKL